MDFRFATRDDVPELASMNAQLLLDTNHHRKGMAQDRLRERMASWIAGEYQAVIFSERETAGYALFRRDEDGLYLRQFFVKEPRRRQGLGRAAFVWLMGNPWEGESRIRLDVLSDNRAALDFWKAVGFSDYSVTLVREK